MRTLQRLFITAPAILLIVIFSGCGRSEHFLNSTEHQIQFDNESPDEKPDKKIDLQTLDTIEDCKSEDFDNVNATRAQAIAPLIRDNKLEENAKVQIVPLCHYPSGDLNKGHTLMLPPSAIKAHLAHHITGEQDTLGECDE